MRRSHRPRPKSHQVAVRLPEALLGRLETYAGDHGVTRSAAIVHLLLRGLGRRPRPLEGKCEESK